MSSRYGFVDPDEARRLKEEEQQRQEQIAVERQRVREDEARVIIGTALDILTDYIHTKARTDPVFKQRDWHVQVSLKEYPCKMKGKPIVVEEFPFLSLNLYESNGRWHIDLLRTNDFESDRNYGELTTVLTQELRKKGFREERSCLIGVCQIDSYTSPISGQTTRTKRWLY